MFHYQKQLLPKKTEDFLFEENSEKWIKELDKAFNNYFNLLLENGNIQDMLSGFFSCR